MDRGAVQDSPESLVQTVAELDVFVRSAAWVECLEHGKAARVARRRGHADHQHGAARPPPRRGCRRRRRRPAGPRAAAAGREGQIASYLAHRRRCCRTLSSKDSHREFMRLDGMHVQACTRPLPHDELVQLHGFAS